MFELIEGDAFELLRNLPQSSAHCAVIDFPWNYDMRNGAGRFEFRARADDTRENIRESDEHMYRMEKDERFPEALDLVTDVLVDGAWVICFADDRFQDIVRQSMKADADLIFRRNWAWTPKQWGMGYYGRINHYPIPVATVGETDRLVRDRPTLFEVESGRQTDYSTGKPIELYQKLLEPPVVHDGERLLEPFCGSAPGAYVARERGLQYWGCDVNRNAFANRKQRTSGGLLD